MGFKLTSNTLHSPPAPSNAIAPSTWKWVKRPIKLVGSIRLSGSDRAHSHHTQPDKPTFKQRQRGVEYRSTPGAVSREEGTGVCIWDAIKGISQPGSVSKRLIQETTISWVVIVS